MGAEMLGEMAGAKDATLDLVGMVYDAALDRHKWPVFLDAFSRAAGGCSALLRSADCKTGKADLIASVGHDPAWQDARCNHSVKLDYLTGTLSQFKLCEAGSTDRIFCPPLQRKPEFFDDCPIPRGRLHALGILLDKDGSNTLLFAAQRGKRAGAFGEEQARLMGVLAPHVTRAARVHRRIGALSVEKEWALGALDHLRAGVILTNNSGTPLFVNRAAEQMLAPGRGINTYQGRLALPGTAETAQLYKLIAGAAQGAPGATRGGDMRIALPNSEFLHCMVIPVPLAFSAHWGIPVASGCVAVFLSKPSGLQLPPQRLAALYGLTPAEARLAAKLAALRSVEQAADELFITPHTARSHLKAIFAKTGAQSQSALLMLLATGTLAHQRDERDGYGFAPMR